MAGIASALIPGMTNIKHWKVVEISTGANMIACEAFKYGDGATKHYNKVTCKACLHSHDTMWLRAEPATKYTLPSLYTPKGDK